MIREGNITVKTYGGLHIQLNPMFSGSGGGTTGPPKKPKKAPVKPPKKK